MGLLARPPVVVPGALVHASQLLRSNGITVTRIIAVRPEAILYLGSGRCPMTAWLTASISNTSVEIACEPGFPAERTPGLKPRNPFAN